jgi:predicted DNA-binding transcriptional regulator YafY
MQFLDKQQKLEQLLSLINDQNTGTAAQLAYKLCVSRPTIENYLNLLRTAGHNISYCSKRKTYYFFDHKP